MMSCSTSCPTPYNSPCPEDCNDYDTCDSGATSIVNHFANDSSLFLQKLTAPHHQPWTFDFATHPLAGYFANRPTDFGWHQYHVDHHTFLKGWFLESGLAQWISYHRKNAFAVHYEYSVHVDLPSSQTTDKPECPDDRLADKESYAIEAALCLITLAFNYGVLHFNNGTYTFGTFEGGPMDLVHEVLSNTPFQTDLESKLLEAIGKCHVEIIKDVMPGSILPDLKTCLPQFHKAPEKFMELPYNDVVKAAIESYEEWIPAFEDFDRRQDEKQTKEEKAQADMAWENMKAANEWKGKNEVATTETKSDGKPSESVNASSQQTKCCGSH
jgi:hypothetical protein